MLRTISKKSVAGEMKNVAFLTHATFLHVQKFGKPQMQIRFPDILSRQSG